MYYLCIVPSSAYLPVTLELKDVHCLGDCVFHDVQNNKLFLVLFRVEDQKLHELYRQRPDICQSLTCLLLYIPKQHHRHINTCA